MLTVEERKKLEEEDLYDIKELFNAEVDSWFSADIACCDNCVDDFLKSWPFAYDAEGKQFQLNQIDLDSFFVGTRLSQVYSEEDFFRFVRLVSCPRCGLELTSNFIPYSFPFEPVDDFENIIEEIALLSKNSPFLLLKHSFAVQVFNAIKELSEEVPSLLLSTSLYRARVASQIEIVKKNEFDITPRKFAGEGRYNHSGLPAFYLGSDLDTCYQELRCTDSYIAELKLEKKIKILDLTATYENHQKHSDLLDTLVYSALISAKRDEDNAFKPQYIFSRFVADCAKFVGFDAIKYPSTRTHESSFNIVLLNNEFSLGNNISINKVFLYKGKNRVREVEICT
ncbi:hypothetical protein VIBNISOn1_800024 [Vibrio nigripulchritudo SOn1]|uniref:RES domain-containing protein n=1 Tax=Vibrio nigripulchritudo SOn1 TaxID=1238450 RepID=A0AAV2VWW1_9VIBR|nr:RES family NAD+ phosphorylase [Vibrio nigripulchritudo]CCO49243.1 hypothetical protein VIBNISOn1_800024 [Vibrio nigripulchritudo SOn1]